MSTEKLTKFAFWQYDQPPYIVGAETDGKRDKDGRVLVPAYGNGARVKPLKVMSVIEGKETLRKIHQLNDMRRAACDAAHRLFKQDVIEAAPFMKKVFKK